MQTAIRRMNAITAALAVCVAAILCAHLQTAFGAADLQKLHLIIDEKDVENKTSEVQLDIDFNDIPEYMMDEIKRGDYRHLIDLENSVAGMNKTYGAVDLSNSEEVEWYSRRDRSIIGPDGRLPVDDRERYLFPYCAIGQLESGCTAAFIGPKHALTAAHCVYDTGTDRYKTNLDLWRRRTCNSEGVRMRYANKVYVPEGYTKYHSSSYDYALILYEDTSPCRLSFGYDEGWQDHGFDIIGYPGDKQDNDLFHCSFDSMFFSSCHYSYTYGSSRFRYRCDTYPGNSGSPLFSQTRGDEEGRRAVYGVHTSGTGTSTYNKGTRITKSRFCSFVKWMHENGYTAMCGGKPCCSDGGSGGCFPAHTTVFVDDIRAPQKLMEDLKLGDRVLSTTTTGELVYSPVIAFLDKSDKVMAFVKIETNNNEHFLTSTHLIFRHKLSSGSLSTSEAVFASKIQAGDYIFTLSSNKSIIAETVNTVSYVDMEGAYGPLTAEGTVVVNNIATSCYAVIENHNMLHTVFAPLRFINKWVPGLLLPSPEQNGQHWYTHLLTGVGQYIHPYIFSESELSPTFYNYV